MKNDPEKTVQLPVPDRYLRYARPGKEAVRAWLLRVIASRRPPPEIREIQNDLWYLPRSEGMKDES